MAANGSGATVAVGKRRHRRSKVMSEINVTPFVDVMLVVLIVFMVAAPLLTVTIPIDLPEAKGGSPLDGKVTQLDVSAKKVRGSCSSSIEIYLGDSLIPLSELEAKIAAIKASGKAELARNVRIRGDRDVCYSDIMKVLGTVRKAGFGADIVILPEREG
jgi:biopolymer transport protein TolR